MNIDTYLLRAREAAGSWSATAAVEAARALGGGRPEAVIDWDDGAGESWVRLLAGNTVIAYVSTVVPLAMITGQSAETTGLDSVAQSITVSSMTDPELSSSQAAIETAFGPSERFGLLDLEQFSADDLWYATV